MLVDELKQYRSLIREIDEIDRKLQSYRTHATVRASIPNRTVTIHGYRIGCGNDVHKLKMRKENYVKKCNEIEQFIYNIDDSLMRRIFKYRYIVGSHRMSWQQVAFKIGESDESYPRQKHNRYLRHLEKVTENTEKVIV